jgi:cytochrome c551/c552
MKPALSPRRLGAAVALVSVSFALALGACSSERAADDASAGNGLPCSVSALLVKKCQSCHASDPKFGAPMPLVTRADLVAPSKSDASRRVAELVTARIHDAARPMPAPPNTRLTAAELKLLDDWVASGTPATSNACTTSPAPSGGATVGTEVSCAKNEHLRPSEPYRMPSDVDDVLVCYGWDSPHATKRHIIGLAPAIDGAKALHHVTLLQSDSEVSRVPGPCEPSAMSAWRPLYGWAPGAGGLELPPAAGLALEPGGHYVVQLHFTNPSHAAVVDASGFDLCSTEKLRPNDADVMAFGTTEITVPARGSLARDCSVTVPKDGAVTHLIAAFPHMHELGTAISSIAYPGGTGAPVDLGTVAAWDLGNQTWLPLDYTLRPGDVVRSQCSWTNPYDHGVGYGPTAEDEMCFSYVMYFPKIVQDWHWSLPALHSTCR